MADTEPKTPLHLVPFGDDHLEQAAILLAARHRRDRSRNPLLPARFEAPAAAREAVAACWRRPQTSGTAALVGDQLVGYLFADLADDPPRGRLARVRLAGHALAAGEAAERLRDLYAAAAGDWLERGSVDHRVFLPAGDDAARDAWFRLGFGADQCYALLDLTALPERPAEPPPDLEIRRAGPRDGAILAGLSQLIALHQALAPAWVTTDAATLAELRAGFAELADDETVTVWLAFRNGAAVGYQAYFPAPPGAEDLLTPERCCELKVGATVAPARGTGVGSALTRHGLAHQRGLGFRACRADWHVPSLTASRFWPRWGFVPAAQRLRRLVGEAARGQL